MTGTGKSIACVLIAMALFQILWTQAGLTQTVQTLPEIDTYVKINPNVGFTFQAKETRESEAPTQAEIGPSLNFSISPLIGVHTQTGSKPDSAKSGFTMISIGYRYMPQANDVRAINRMEPVVDFHMPAVAGFLLSNKNRADLDWQGGGFTWRYRNRSQIQRSLQFGRYRLVPYASAEFFYESQYRKWSDTAVYAGCVLPIATHIQLDPYYEHQNVTGKKPNQQLNQIGFILSLYFGDR